MSDRPTPETDAEQAMMPMGGFTLDFCRKLERERDEWREIATELADAAAYGLAQWDDGYTLEASRKIGESIMRFQKMANAQ